MYRTIAVSALAIPIAFAQRVGTPTDDLDKLSIDDLFKLQVTSVGRKAQELSKAPAAVFVLTAEDIRRSGATSIPEALQWVPGLTVLRIDGRSWAISARGGARLYSDKILVMIDGRSLYTPLFSGVIWDSIDVPLGNIDRIEVIRGPGAVMWGPNAVNGVINIITKEARATAGGEARFSSGNELRASTEARWGGSSGDSLSYRIWGKLEERTPAYGSQGLYNLNSFIYTAPSVTDLDAASARLGFRFDGRASQRDQWTVQGDVYGMGRHDPAVFPALAPSVDIVAAHSGYDGGYLQGAWTRNNQTGGESVLQFSYDRMHASYPFIGWDYDNVTVDYQQRRDAGERHEIYIGAGYQQYRDATETVRYVGFRPEASVYRAGDIVVRDEWQMVRSRLMASAGIRFDYSNWNRLDYQPSVRLLYTPAANQSAWLALSRAVRSPARVDRDMQLENGSVSPFGVPVPVGFSGSHNARSETERSLEAGYRYQSGQRWSFDLSSFWSYYQRLRVVSAALIPYLDPKTGQPQFMMYPDSIGNGAAGRSYGAEVWGTWQAVSNWRISPSYSYVHDARWLPSSLATGYLWDRTPQDLRHQAGLRSQHDLSRSLQLDLMARARSRDANFHLPGALLLDARLGWRPTRDIELSLSIQNVTDRRVIEVYPEGPIPSIPLRRNLVLTLGRQFGKP